MHSAEEKQLAAHRLQKAEECYTAANNLLLDCLYYDSANRSYYAIFHALRALLALEGTDFKKHSGVISHFQQQYIKTGVFEREYSDYVRGAFQIRQDCDYEDFFLVTKEEVQEQLMNARKIIDRVKKYLNTID